MKKCHQSKLKIITFFKNTSFYFVYFKLIFIFSFLVRNIQEENVQKKQTVLKLLSVLRENPEILEKTQKAGNPTPGFSCIEAAQSTPG